MADINVSIDENSNTFTIRLDKYEWTDLEVNGEKIEPINEGDTQFLYTHQLNKSNYFIATADHNISLAHPGATMFLKGPKGQKGQKETFYMLSTNYEETKDPKKVKLHGVIGSFKADSFPFAQNSPIGFNQGKMTGTFQD